MSRSLSQGQLTQTLLGTPEYMAPEVFKTQDKRVAGYDKSVDWWAVGILIYEMIVGVTPFFHSNRLTMNKKIINEKVRWPSNIRCSPLVQDLVSKLLNKNASQRLGTTRGATEILEHPWFPQGEERT